MSLKLEVLGVMGRPGPERALVFSGRLRWIGIDRAFVLGIGGRLKLNERVLTERVAVNAIDWEDRNFSLIVRDRECLATLVAPLSAEALHFVEEERGRGDVFLRLELAYRWQEVIARKRQLPGILLGGRVVWETSTIDVPLSREAWMERLQEMGWSEAETFEVAVLPLLTDRNLAESLRMLNEAQASFRIGEYKEVITSCRAAFESAARAFSQGDARRGFELLRAKAFGEHEAKQRAFDRVLEAMAGYAHTLGQRGLRVSRGEAELVLTSTLGVFSLLSRRLAKRDSG